MTYESTIDLSILKIFLTYSLIDRWESLVHVNILEYHAFPTELIVWLQKGAVFIRHYVKVWLVNYLKKARNRYHYTCGITPWYD